MRKGKKWLKEEVFKLYPSHDVMYVSPDYEAVAKTETISKVLELIDQLDESELTQDQVDKYLYERNLVSVDAMMVHQTGMQNKVVAEKPVIPQFAADYIEKWKYEGLIMHEWFTFDHDNQDEDKVSKWLYNNDYETNKRRELMLIDAIRYGYEVDKEILWKIPLPDLKTSDGHIQYLTYDPEAKTYFAGIKNVRLKQTFNAKDLASVPTPHRHYAVLCDFNKIEEESE